MPSSIPRQTSGTTGNAFRLSPEQVLFFEVFGYLHLPGLFGQEAARLSDAFDRAMASCPGDVITHIHAAHYESRRIALCQFVERDPFLFGLLTDQRITTIAETLVGADYNYLSSDGNIFTADTVWHRDSYGLVRKHRYIKVLFYLEDIDAGSGALRVIPGSHHQGQPFSRILHETLENPRETLSLDADAVPCQILPTRAGDAIVFDYTLQHATCHSHFPRRMFSIGLTAHFPDPLQQQAVEAIKKIISDFGPPYGDAIRNHPDPAFRPHVVQMLQLADEAQQQLARQSGQATPVPPRPQ